MAKILLFAGLFLCAQEFIGGNCLKTGKNC